MTSYDNWNRVEDEGEEELQDLSYFDGGRDVVLFAIDCSPSMLKAYEDSAYEDAKTCHVLAALDAAIQIQKRKVIVGPNDMVGIMMFNTTRKNEGRGQGAEIKRGNFLFQPLEPINAPRVQELMRLADSARENPKVLHEAFPSLEGSRVPTGDIFTSCNWVLRDGAPITATKRIFLVTDEDDPHPGNRAERLIKSAETTLVDLVQAGVSIEPFFISTEDKPFDLDKFYRRVLHESILGSNDVTETESGGLPESLSITRIEELLAQMRIHESPKRALFSIPLQLGDGFAIGIKGYGLVTEQRKGQYKYFLDLGDRMEVAHTKTGYVDENREAEVSKDQFLFGMELGTNVADGEQQDGDDSGSAGPVRIVKRDCRVFYTAEEAESFRTLGLNPGIKLLGFKNYDELAFEDNVRHSVFIYPDEMVYSGSRRTFVALIRAMIKKKRIGLCLAVLRKNSAPMFYAMIPQLENIGQGDPAGIHLIPLPFADDIRAAPIESALRATDEQAAGARAWIDKLCVKNGAYPPDAYPNPSLAYHNAQLQASAFREEWDPETFEDPTLPSIDRIHSRAGHLLARWKAFFTEDSRFNDLMMTPGVKRKPDLRIEDAEMQARFEGGSLGRMTVEQLKDFCKAKSLPVSGRKADILERVVNYLEKH